MADKFSQLHFQAGVVFTPGSPVNERDLFAGRTLQIQSIIDTVSQRGYHGVLYGERGVGKTSLANVLAQFLSDSVKALLVPRVNCDASDTYSTLWRKAFNDILITKSRPGMGFGAQDIEETHSVVEGLPQTITPNDVRHLLGQLGRGVLLVVIFDEYDRLKDPTITALMADTIKVLSDHATPATVVLIGVADSVDALIGEHQSIERALVQVNMPRMSDAEIAQIIENGVKRLGMTADVMAIEEIKSLSQGMPYVAHLLALHIVRAALEDKSLNVTLVHVEKGISKSLAQWQQSTKSAYYLATKSQQPDTIYREVLLACALAERDSLGYFTAAAVRKPLQIITGKPYDIPNFARHLKQLSEPGRGDMLQRVGEKRRIRYRFTSPILCPYILMKGVDDKLLDKEKLGNAGPSPQ